MLGVSVSAATTTPTAPCVPTTIVPSLSAASTWDFCPTSNLGGAMSLLGAVARELVAFEGSSPLPGQHLNASPNERKPRPLTYGPTLKAVRQAPTCLTKDLPGGWHFARSFRFFYIFICRSYQLLFYKHARRHVRRHARAHADTHTRTHAHARAHAHTQTHH